MSDDFLPTASLEILRRRSRLLQAVRDFFTSRDYWEVQTPTLSHDCCIDVWLDPFVVPLGRGEQGYLQTSPEFAMKRLMCAGADRIFEVARVFRQDETGDRHNPEFTMIEWYQRGSDHREQMEFVEALVRQMHGFCQYQNWPEIPSLPGKFERYSYQQAFEEFVGVSPANSSTEELFVAARKRNLPVPAGMEQDHDGLLNFLLAEVVEPVFQKRGGVFLFDFPASQAALATIRPEAFPVAERFELYLNGVELCNGYHELTDADELKSRMHSQNQQRKTLGKPSLSPNSRLLQAMARPGRFAPTATKDIYATQNPREHQNFTTVAAPGLPPCAGVALGFDRLAMWCLGQPSIRDVIPFPFDRA